MRSIRSIENNESLDNGKILLMKTLYFASVVFSFSLSYDSGSINHRREHP